MERTETNVAIIDLYDIRTPKIYYQSWKYSEYKIVSYTPKSGIHMPGYLSDELKESLNQFDRDHKSEYVIGVGAPINIDPSSHETLTFEWFKSLSQSSDDVELLQCVLSLGRKLLIDGEWRRTNFTDKEKKMVLSFCNRYGLNDSGELMRVQMNSGEIVTRACGFNFWSFCQGAQSLYIAFERMNELLEGGNTQDVNLVMSTTDCGASITSQSYYSKKDKRIHTILCANTLLDLARYQLGMVMEGGLYRGKCANPQCNTPLFGGRSDRTTCSGACRQALFKINKRRNKAELIN